MTRMGCVEQKDGRKWIGTIHPAFIMRMPDWKDAALDHLRKADKIAGTAIPLPEINTHPTQAQILAAVDYVCLEGREFSDDVETHQENDIEEDDYVGGDYKVDMCGISYAPYKALVVDPEEIHLLAPCFADPTIWRYEHNGPYDEYHIAKFIQNRRAKLFDTMLATHYLRSHQPKKLKPFVVSQYTNLPYYGRDLEKVSRRLYNGMDVVATLLAAKEMRKQLQDWKLEELFFEFGMPLLPILEELRVKGCNVDLKKALFFQRMTQAKIDKAYLLISKICGSMFNPRSDKQVMELIYDHWKLPEQTKIVPVVGGLRGATKTIRTVDFEARKRLRWFIEAQPERLGKFKQAYYLLQLLDYLSGEEKKLEYLGRISGDGRIHPYYKAHGERPFRLSSSPNVQNFPVYDMAAWGGARRDDTSKTEVPIGVEEEKAGGAGSLRSIVIPDHEDDVLLTCDFEQLQLWIYAVQFNVKWLLSIFKSREYIYGVVYEKLYKEPFFQEGQAKTKKFKLRGIPEQRIRRAKAVPLGFLFGRSSEAVAKEYGWPEREAADLRSWWYGLNPELPQSYDTIKYKLAQQGRIRHSFGQIIHYPSGKLTEAINSHAQSNEAFIMIGSLIAIDKEFKRRGYHNTRIILTVHDSVTINVPESHCQEVYEEIVAPILSRPIKQLNNFEFRHSAEVSKMWDWEVKDYNEWKLDYNNARTASADCPQSA